MAVAVAAHLSTPAQRKEAAATPPFPQQRSLYLFLLGLLLLFVACQVLADLSDLEVKARWVGQNQVSTSLRRRKHK
jgi:hypothetical protein